MRSAVVPRRTCFVAVRVSSGLGAGNGRLSRARHGRWTAMLRFSKRVTARWPGSWFQISMKRPMGQFEETVASSSGVVNETASDGSCTFSGSRPTLPSLRMRYFLPAPGERVSGLVRHSFASLVVGEMGITLLVFMARTHTSLRSRTIASGTSSHSPRKPARCDGRIPPALFE
jgi:hypothetical protein